MNPEDIKIKYHSKFEATLVLAEGGSVGYDISLPPDEGGLIMPYNSRRTIDTGIIFDLPEKCWMLVTPRSNSRTRNFRISNTMGVIDPSFHGPGDHLFVDVTRGPKLSEFVGMINLEDLHDPEKKAKWYAEHDLTGNEIMQTVKCPVTDDLHFYKEMPTDFMVYPPEARFCQVIFLPYYRVDLLHETLENWAWGEDNNRGGSGSTGIV